MKVVVVGSGDQGGVLQSPLPDSALYLYIYTAGSYAVPPQPSSVKGANGKKEALCNYQCLEIGDTHSG